MQFLQYPLAGGDSRVCQTRQDKSDMRCPLLLYAGGAVFVLQASFDPAMVPLPGAATETTESTT